VDECKPLEHSIARRERDIDSESERHLVSWMVTSAHHVVRENEKEASTGKGGTSLLSWSPLS
jgi:hypothetical protein